MFSLDNVAGHSGVMKAANLTVGDNQANWFRGKGGDHSFSMHHTKEIRWSGGGTVQGSAQGTYRLIAVPEKAAREVVFNQVAGLRNYRFASVRPRYRFGA